MKKHGLSKAFARLPFRPFFLALFGAAFLSLPAVPAYAQNANNNEAISLFDILERLKADIAAFEVCHPDEHEWLDIIRLYEYRAQTTMQLALIYPLIPFASIASITLPGTVESMASVAVTLLIDLIFERGLPSHDSTMKSLITASLINARQAFEILEQYPCPSPPEPPENSSGGSGGDSSNGSGGDSGGGSGGDSSNGSGGDSGGSGGDSSNGSGGGSSGSSGEGCSTTGGPFGLVALAALFFVRRKARP